MARQYGRWIIKRPLNEGGQAHTFLVYDVQDPEKKPFVLKRLKNIDRLQRFKREIDAGLQLVHQNVLNIIDSELEGSNPYFISEFCSGGSLDNADLSELTTLDRLRLLLGICRGVAYAHDMGVVHRDLKPGNIFLRDELRNPVVGDFGLCFIADEDGRFTFLDEAVGPRWYMPPELGHGLAEEVTPAADVYSLGKMLYWLLAGRIFDREVHRTARFNLTRDQVRPDYYFIYDLFDETIVEDPAKRLGTANDVARRTEDIIRRIEMQAHHIDLSTPQACGYCGTGVYQIVLNASRETMGNNLVSSVQNFGFYGGLNSPEWLIFVCDHCANVQIFRPDLAKERNIWKGR